MLKNRKEKLLASVLLIIIVSTSGFDMVHSMVFGSLDEKQRQLRSLENAIQDRELEFRRIQHAQRSYEDLRLRSLPPDPSVASTLYQAWLITLAEELRIKSPDVQAGRANAADPAGFRVPFTFVATMNLAQLGQLLDHIAMEPLLHNVRHLTIHSETQQQPSMAFKVSLGIDTLCLHDATVRSTLVDPDADTTNEIDSQVERFFAGDNLLIRGYNGPPEFQRPQPTTTPTRAAIPPKMLFFTASLEKNGRQEAWLYDGRTKEHFEVTVGDSVELLGQTLAIISLSDQQMTIDLNGVEKDLSLGDSVTIAARTQANLSRRLKERKQQIRQTIAQ